jgi:hypothetical protein
LTKSFQGFGQQLSVGAPAALGNSLRKQIPCIFQAPFAARLLTKRQKRFGIKHWVQINMPSDYSTLRRTNTTDVPLYGDLA